MTLWFIHDTGRRRWKQADIDIDDFRSAALEVRLYHAARGEAIVISRNGNAMLVDGGSSNGTTNNLRGRLLGAELQPGSVHAILATHPHRDHDNFHPVLADEFSGVDSVFTAARPRYFDNATAKADAHYDGIPNNDAAFDRVRVVQNTAHDAVDRVPTFDPDVEVHLLRSNETNIDDDYRSVFMFLRFGECWMLFTGDTEIDYEDALRDRLLAINDRAHLWKLTHHGNREGTSPDLLAALRPAIAVCSSNDDAGHELDSEVRSRLRNVLDGAIVYATHDTARSTNPRDIIVRTDGSLWEDDDHTVGVLFEVTRVATVLF